MKQGDIIEYRQKGETKCGTVIEVCEDVVTIIQPLNSIEREVEKEKIRNVKKRRG